MFGMRNHWHLPPPYQLCFRQHQQESQQLEIRRYIRSDSTSLRHVTVTGLALQYGVGIARCDNPGQFQHLCQDHARECSSGFRGCLWQTWNCLKSILAPRDWWIWTDFASSLGFSRYHGRQSHPSSCHSLEQGNRPGFWHNHSQSFSPCWWSLESHLGLWRSSNNKMVVVSTMIWTSSSGGGRPMMNPTEYKLQSSVVVFL